MARKHSAKDWMAPSVNVCSPSVLLFVLMLKAWYGSVLACTGQREEDEAVV